MIVYHRLALAMGRTVKELLAALDSQELTRWLAFYRIEPWGDARADHHAASICMWVYTMMRSKASRSLTLKDFLISFGPKPVQTEEDMKSALMILTAQAGGTLDG